MRAARFPAALSAAAARFSAASAGSSSSPCEDECLSTAAAEGGCSTEASSAGSTPPPACCCSAAAAAAAGPSLSLLLPRLLLPAAVKLLASVPVSTAPGSVPGVWPSCQAAPDCHPQAVSPCRCRVSSTPAAARHCCRRWQQPQACWQQQQQGQHQTDLRMRDCCRRQQARHLLDIAAIRTSCCHSSRSQPWNVTRVQQQRPCCCCRCIACVRPMTGLTPSCSFCNSAAA